MNNHLLLQAKLYNGYHALSSNHFEQLAGDRAGVYEGLFDQLDQAVKRDISLGNTTARSILLSGEIARDMAFLFGQYHSYNKDDPATPAESRFLTNPKADGTLVRRLDALMRSCYAPGSDWVMAAIYEKIQSWIIKAKNYLAYADLAIKETPIPGVECRGCKQDATHTPDPTPALVYVEYPSGTRNVECRCCTRRYSLVEIPEE